MDAPTRRPLTVLAMIFLVFTAGSFCELASCSFGDAIQRTDDDSPA